VGTTSDPTGINDLVIDGTTYNVTFSFTPAASLFTAGTQQSRDAATSLASALTDLSVVGLNNSGGPAIGLTVQVDGITPGDGVGYGFSSQQWFAGFTSTPPSFGSNIFCDLNKGVCGGDVTVAANFTAAATPLPAALPLFAVGLGGLGLLGRRRKRKTN
jgi:hypothetical protein